MRLLPTAKVPRQRTGSRSRPPINVNGRYDPDGRTSLKVKCLNREEFVLVGWSEPEGIRHRIGSLLLGYYAPEGNLVYAGRVGTGMPVNELERL